MKLPAVSILMAVRNEEQFLPAALNSILRQSLENWELVVVDDGSTDETPKILDSYAGHDKRIRFIRQEADGLVAALNRGLTSCRTGLVARMDGDDICHPQRLEKQVAFLNRNPEVDIVACKVRHFPSHHVQNGMRYYEKWQNGLLEHEVIMRNIFIEAPLAQPSVMFRTNSVINIDGYRDMGWAEDYDLWLRLAENGARFAKIPEFLLFWREHQQRLTHYSAHFSLASFRQCKAHFLNRSYLKGEKHVTLWGAGIEGKAWRKTLDCIGIKVGCWIEIDPNKVGQNIHDAPVVEPESLSTGCGPILITIGTRGARHHVREKCRGLGLLEGSDFVCVT